MSEGSKQKWLTARAKVSAPLLQLLRVQQTVRGATWAYTRSVPHNTSSRENSMHFGRS